MSNGKLALSTLTKIASGQHLRTDAAAAFVRLSAAFEAQFGTPLGVTDSYRSYAAQVAVKKAKGKFAATPGTSNHGWGIALDLASRVNQAGSAEHKWMQKNAGRFGWVNPYWARDSNPTNGQFEPWHWEFNPALVQPTQKDEDMAFTDAEAARLARIEALLMVPGQPFGYPAATHNALGGLIVQTAAQDAVIKRLADAQGLDSGAIKTAIDAAVTEALSGLKVTLSAS